MADFEGWALQYVLADDEVTRQDAVARTDAALGSASVRSTAILAWVQSIDPWMPAALSSTGVPQDDHAAGESEFDVVARAKALDYLADTLSIMDRALLRADQVNLLAVFFGRLFNVDHKAGILAAAKALRRLAMMKDFKPDIGESIIQSIASMRDDFRLQPPQTRMEVYALLQVLISHEAVSNQLQHTYGTAGGFALDLLQLCNHERDPSCLLQWFGILQGLLRSFSFSSDVDEELFKSFSAYFPISMRSSVNPAGVTVDDLKLSLRTCFSASGKLAKLALPFLIQKLDQGDAITVPVKESTLSIAVVNHGVLTPAQVDILKTLDSCLERYQHPSRAIAPFANQIWNSLKYEVRNGEIREILDSTLGVMRTLSSRLATMPLSTPAVVTQDQCPLEAFTTTVMGDCLEDLANPSYTKPAGLLLESVMGAHAKSFALMLPGTLDAIAANLRDPRTSGHARACLGFLASLLDSRARLVRASAAGTVQSGSLRDLEALDSLVLERAYATLTRSWKDNNVENPDADHVATLKEAARGLAALACQPGAPTVAGASVLLCSDHECNQICAMISDRIVNIFNLASSPDTGPRKELADVAVVALRDIVGFYPSGYSTMLNRAMLSIQDRRWGDQPSRNSLDMLKTLLLRLSYIGCSNLPSSGHPLLHFRSFVLSMQQLTFSYLDQRIRFDVPTIAVSAVYNALMLFRDACLCKGFLARHGMITDSWARLTAGFDYPFPELPLATSQLASESGSRSGKETEQAATSDVFREYLEYSLSALIRFYHRATAYVADPAPGPRLSLDFRNAANISNGVTAHETDLQDIYLHQLADMATFVVRDIEQEEQQSLQIPEEAFSLFATGHPPTMWLSAHDDGRTNVLSLGLLRGLRTFPPSQMLELEVFAESILHDVTTAEAFPERTQKVRDCILTVIANKWIPGSSVSAPARQAWKATISSLESVVREPNTGMRLERYSRILAVLAGAIARRDKDIDHLATLMSALPASLGHAGGCMARCLEDLVSCKERLEPENHAIVKPLYKQWVYVRFASSKLQSSFPITQDKPEGEVQAITVIRLLKHMDLCVYEEDIITVLRVAIAGVSSFHNYGDVEAALDVLREVLKHSPGIMKDQIKAVVSGAVKALKCGLEQSPRQAVGLEIPARFRREGSPARCRDAVLLLLKDLAQSFDEGLLGQYSASMSRVLGDACGDPVREVRQSALAARRSWARIRQH
ncbi:hypothetical protein RB595_009827 [Gaeumannomyces hyphopodioides]